MCGDVFRASCDVEPASCAVAWLLVLLSAIVHAWRCCALEDDATDAESVVVVRWLGLVGC